MNYRLDLDYEPDVKPTKVKVGSEKHVAQLAQLNQMIGEALAANDYHFLWQHDQLCREMNRGAIFSGFKEMALNFVPTFKVKRERQLTNEERNSGQKTFFSDIRMPSYCDRILYRSMPALAQNLTAVDFTSIPDVFTSDHKPVRATFALKPSHLPEKYTSPAHNTQIMFSDLVCTGGGMEDRNGVYLIFSGFPSNLTSKLVTKSEPKPVWKSSYELRLKVRPSTNSVEESKLHVIISVLDDKIGADETCGDVLIPVADVLAAPNSTCQFSLPLVHNGTNTGAVLTGTAVVIRQGEQGFSDWAKRKKFRGRSVWQLV
jgi:hypothetical protein